MFDLFSTTSNYLLHTTLEHPATPYTWKDAARQKCCQDIEYGLSRSVQFRSRIKEQGSIVIQWFLPGLRKQPANPSQHSLSERGDSSLLKISSQMPETAK
jgi:hypothetical protein